MQQQNAQELNTFQPSYRDSSMIIDENGNRQMANNSKNLETIRASPYYYNETSGMHATNNNSETTFYPINNRSDSFGNFMTSMYPDNA